MLRQYNPAMKEMQRFFQLAWLMLSLAMLAGCGGSGTPSTSQPSPASSYAYLATGGTSKSPPYDLMGYGVNASTGALTPVSGSPFSLPNAPVDVAEASESGGAFLFVLMQDPTTQTSTLQSYSVNATTGALTAAQTINYPANTNQYSLTIDPSEKFLYVMEDGSLLAYSINSSTGNLTKSSTTSQQQFGADQSFVVAPPGSFAYQVNMQSGYQNVYTYSVSPTDGSLTVVESTLSPLGFGAKFYTDPKGLALYQVNNPSGEGDCPMVEISQINSANGMLTSVGLFSAPCVPVSMSFNPADTFGYVNSEPSGAPSSDGIYAATVDSTTGNLTTVSGSPFASGSGVSFGAVEPSQGLLLLESQGAVKGSNEVIQVYAIDSSTGALSAVSGAQVELPSNVEAYVGKILTVVPSP
jgi:6-phosphogluconolactonase (cycloisomerase 2 family)